MVLDFGRVINMMGMGIIPDFSKPGNMGFGGIPDFNRGMGPPSPPPGDLNLKSGMGMGIGGDLGHGVGPLRTESAPWCGAVSLAFKLMPPVQADDREDGPSRAAPRRPGAGPGKSDGGLP